MVNDNVERQHNFSLFCQQLEFPFYLWTCLAGESIRNQMMTEKRT